MTCRLSGPGVPVAVQPVRQTIPSQPDDVMRKSINFKCKSRMTLWPVPKISWIGMTWEMGQKLADSNRPRSNVKSL